LKTESGEHLKPRSQYVDEAIQLAIAGRWQEATDLNRFIVDKFGGDQETHNRLGKALTELGQLDAAKAEYSATLAINPMNTIARKNSARIDSLLHTNEGVGASPTKVDLNLFVEEMGKTVTTVLENVEAEACTKVAFGDLAELRIEGDGIVAETVRGVRLGQIEPKLARRLIKFTQGGNRYQAGITACDGGSVKLIIRETYQDPKFAGKPSFPMRRKREVDFRPYAKESLLPAIDTYEPDEEDLVEGEDVGSDMDGLHQVEDDSDAIDFADEADEDLDDEP
jgi:hypothetical protein